MKIRYFPRGYLIEQPIDRRAVRHLYRNLRRGVARKQAAELVRDILWTGMRAGIGYHHELTKQVAS